MSRVIRAALFQTAWTGDKESMIQVHEQAARDAAAQGAQVLCFQELFYGPYFCQVQDPAFYEYAEQIPDGPIVKRFQALARELGIVLVLPMYEEEQPGVLYNTAAVIDADGTYLGKYRKHHIPQVRASGRSSTSVPGNAGWPVFDTAVGQDRRLHLLRPALPGGLARAGPRRRRDRLQPVGHLARPVRATCGSWSSRRRPSPTSTSSARSTGSASRSSATTTSTAPPTSWTRRPSSSARWPATRRPNSSSATWTWPSSREVRDRWQFYRDRRPDAYAPLTAPDEAFRAPPR